MAGLECLLTAEIRAKEYDTNWLMPHYALDNESLHHAILTLLLTKSESFCKALLLSPGKLDRHSPAFDIWMRLENGKTACIEVKVWHHWSADQRERQIATIKQIDLAQGYIILFGKSAEQTKENVREISQGTFQKICYAEIIFALDSVVENADLSEIAAAYKEGLRQQEQRIRKQYEKWDPNA